MAKFKVGDDIPVSAILKITGIQATKQGTTIYNMDHGLSVPESLLEQIAIQKRQFSHAKAEDKPVKHQYKDGDKVRIIANQNGHCFKVGDIVTIYGESDGHKAWRCTCEMNPALFGNWVLEDDMEPCIKPGEKDKPIQEPIKLYCVEGYGKYLTTGKIYEAPKSSHEGRLSMTYDDGWRDDYFNPETDHFSAEHPVVGTRLFPLVKRPAKVGEWVYIDNPDVVPENNDGTPAYKKGDILKVIDKYLTTSIRFREGADRNNTDYAVNYTEYLVLEGYKPEQPKYWSGKAVCVEVDEVAEEFFIKGKTYNFKNGVVWSESESDKGFNYDEPITSLDETLKREWTAKFIEHKGE